MARKVTRRNIAAGCIEGTKPVSKKYFRFMRPAMGSQPSTPGGGAMSAEDAPVSSPRTQK